ncbi:MAG: hypothetical protein EOO41_01515, partial [Methanobacteriota archaeon]
MSSSTAESEAVPPPPAADDGVDATLVAAALVSLLCDDNQLPRQHTELRPVALLIIDSLQDVFEAEARRRLAAPAQSLAVRTLAYTLGAPVWHYAVSALSEAARRPYATAQVGACYGMLALMSRVHAQLCVDMGDSLAAAAYHVLASYAPERAAFVVSAAVHVLHNVVRTVLTQVLRTAFATDAAELHVWLHEPLPQAAASIDPLSLLSHPALPPLLAATLQSLVSMSAVNLFAARGSCREGAAYALGCVAIAAMRPLLSPASGSVPTPTAHEQAQGTVNEGADKKSASGAPFFLARDAMFTHRSIMSRALLSLASAQSDTILKSLALDKLLPHMAPTEAVVRLFRTVALLNLFADAAPADASTLAAGGVVPQSSWQGWIPAIAAVHTALQGWLSSAVTLTSSSPLNPNRVQNTPGALAAAAMRAALMALAPAQAGASGLPANAQPFMQWAGVPSTMDASVSKNGTNVLGGQQAGPITIGGALVAGT